MDRQNWSSVQSAELPRHIYAAAEVEEGSATEDTGAELTAGPPLQSGPSLYWSLDPALFEPPLGLILSRPLRL